MNDPIYWDSTFEIVQQLKATRPNVLLDQVSLNNIFTWVTGMANFADDPAMCNDTILLEILTEWIEETL